jgi:hypothetical protein
VEQLAWADGVGSSCWACRRRWCCRACRPDELIPVVAGGGAHLAGVGLARDALLRSGGSPWPCIFRRRTLDRVLRHLAPVAVSTGQDRKEYRQCQVGKIENNTAVSSGQEPR